MIDFYYWPTPNGWKVSIMLEECGLQYKVIPVNISNGDQFSPLHHLNIFLPASNNFSRSVLSRACKMNFL